MTLAEKKLLQLLEQTQSAYMDLAFERAKEGDVFAVAKAVQRSQEVVRRYEKLKHDRWVA